MLRHYISRLLRESGEHVPFHVIIYEDAGTRETAIFRRGIFAGAEPDYRTLRNNIVGICDIAKPSNPCNGAWEVSAIAGEGRYVYDLAYWLSPSGELMSDRLNMSDDAVAAWTRWGKKSKGRPLDDIDHPRNRDPNDDCEVWLGGEGGIVEPQNNRHRSYLPPDEVGSINQTYRKKPRFDWGLALDETTRLTKKYSSSFIIHVEEAAFAFFKEKNV